MGEIYEADSETENMFKMTTMLLTDTAIEVEKCVADLKRLPFKRDAILAFWFYMS